MQALDLPYVYSTQGEIKEDNLFKFASRSILNAGLRFVTDGDKEAAIDSIKELGHQLKDARDISEQNRRTNSSPADVIMLSGCKDYQTSADAQEEGQSTGAMSHALTSKPQSKEETGTFR